MSLQTTVNDADLTSVAAVVIETMHDLALTGRTVVSQVMAPVTQPICEAHYPSGDEIDTESGFRYYYHSHPGGAWQRREHGHFHLFTAEGGDYTHLVAFSVDGRGIPLRLFATNRWVTAETWQSAPNVLKRLAEFRVKESGPLVQVNRWLNAIVRLFQPEAVETLQARDRRIETMVARGRNIEGVLGDRRIHVLAQTPLSLADRLASFG